ncbi:MAG: magnesium transporter [Lachnospiraceae bacterium]|jgi:magnesium transporter|nr:magnesium transporter [Lachnospiraceae bacterium]
MEPDYIHELVELIRSGENKEKIAEQLTNYHDNDISNALDELNEEERKMLYHILGADRVSEIFAYLDDPGKYLGELALEQAADIIENMDADDAVDVLEEVDEEIRKQLIELIDEESKEDIKLICSYEEDEIGSKMTTNFIEIGRSLTIKQAMRALIAQAEDNDNISTLFVEDDDGTFYGAVDLKDLIVARTYMTLESLITQSFPYVRDHETISECIERLKDYAEDSIPVLNDKNELIGVITAQDIVEVVDDELGDDYAKLAGMTEEAELEESLGESIKKRLPWLVVLLGLSMCVSTVTSLFEGVIAQLAIIVSFQSVILGMSGNVGTQSLAVTIRLLMDENLETKQKIGMIFREMRIGFSNGLILGILSFLLIGAYLCLAKGKSPEYAFAISLCAGIALLMAMTISSIVGTSVPMFFSKIHVDPAVASGPLITTVNDLIGVVTYYGVAWLLLIHIMQLGFS